ncbi:KilA-N domain-containing protein [Brevundimonas diminuta]|uniref:KilA-N domain-containing protein n=1 Tax=Brevundimonas diminuta TaxID=293 RepID=UPI002096BEE6|nr:KilA-N domain-containing protein [Brevundimonas diminuta]MCO8017528.1 KilA-N domain-containing protein [Brevundimonas diminuta]MCO8021048.1 KilA-N domain-containing protein [Brevundimonas diminuta]
MSAPENSQPRLDLIPHDYRGEIIGQRAKDGFINATAMCKAAGKRFNDYARLGTTEAFVAELVRETGIPATELIQSVSGGDPQRQGTWVHPQVAIHLAQWASPRFAVMVSRWVLEWMSGAGSADRAWRVFTDRLDLVSDQVPAGFFCIFRETADVYAALIRAGINPGLRILLDISVGQHWSKFWLNQQLESRFGARARYSHYFPPYWAQSLSNPQTPYCYPEDALGAFKRWLRDVYIPLKMPLYLKDQARKGKISQVEATNAIAALERRERERALPSAA